MGKVTKGFTIVMRNEDGEYQGYQQVFIGDGPDDISDASELDSIRSNILSYAPEGTSLEVTEFELEHDGPYYDRG